MKTLLEIATWNRKEHFHFFSQFEEPFFGVTVEVDCTRSYELAKKKGASFFLTSLHAILSAVNSVPALKLRIEGGEVYQWDSIDASPTVDRPDGTFGFSYMRYDADIDHFLACAAEEVERVRGRRDLEITLAPLNVIHFSSLPWLRFTSLSHARSFNFPDSVPKISTGKMVSVGERRVMPVSIHAHHALVDGKDVGLFFELLGGLL